MNRLLSITFALSMLACSSTLTSLQPAAVLAKGEFHTGTGIVVPTPVTAALRAQESVENGLAQQGLAEAGFAALANLPLPLTQTDVRIGLGHNADAGVRVSVDAITLSGKYQFLGKPKLGGFDASIGLDVSRHFFNQDAYQNAVDINDSRNASADQRLNLFNFAFFALNNVSRTDVTVPVLFGRQPTHWLHYWWGPKYSFSKVNMEAAVEIADGDRDIDENLHYLGGTAGVALGYRRAWMVLEMNAFNLAFKPNIGEQEFDAGGLVVFPALGFITRF